MFRQPQCFLDSDLLSLLSHLSSDFLLEIWIPCELISLHRTLFCPESLDVLENLALSHSEHGVID